MAGEIGEAFVRIRPETTSFRGETTAAVRRDLKQTEREVSRFARGTVLGTGALHGFGRAAVFASTSLLGGYGLTFALRKSVDAARDSQVVQGQLTAAVRAAQIQYSAYRTEIQASIRATDDLGFSEDEATRSYTTLISATRDVATATRDQALAANVARQTGRSLEQATRAVAQAEAGRAGSLQRMLPAIEKGASAEQALLQATAATAGAAEKYANSFAGSQDRLNSAIQRTEVTIGRALIPTVELLSNRLADYLGNAENQKKIQEDVNRAIDEGAKVVHGLAAAIDLVSPPIEAVVRALGGLENAVEDALILGIVLKARKAAVSMGLIGAASTRAAKVVATSAVAENVALATVTASEARATAGFLTISAASVSTRNVIVANAATEAAAISGVGAAAVRSAGLFASLLGGAAKIPAIFATLEALQGAQSGGPTMPNTAKNALLHPIADIQAAGAAIGSLFGITKQSPNRTSGATGEPATLTVADVVNAIQNGQLPPSRLALYRKRFVSDEQYQFALKLSRLHESGTTGLVKGLPNVVAGGKYAPQTRPIGAAGQRAIRLAQNPDDVAAITEQRDYDTRALAFLEKQKATGKITNAKYLEQTLAISSDQQSQQSHLDSIAAGVAADAQSAADKARAAAERARAAAERAAALREKQYRDRLHIQERTLRTAVKTTHDSAQADRKLTDFLRREAHDKRLTGVERSDYASELATEVGREQERDKRIAEKLRTAAALGATVINAASDAYQKVQEKRLAAAKQARETALSIREGGLSLARQAASLAEARAGSDQKLLDKAYKLERLADEGLIRFYEDRAKAARKVKDKLAEQEANRNKIAAQLDLAGIGRKSGGASSFTLAQLYAEAESQFKMYGSNYGPAGTPLSPQDARGQYAAITLKQKGTVNVTQHFHAPTKASQAMNDARSASRYLN